MVFLGMCVHYSGNRFVPSEEIDKKGWHTFLLYTRSYHAFSRSLGVDYIHHEPSDQDQLVERGGAIKTARFMTEKGIAIDPDFWPTTAGLNEGDCSPDPCTCTPCQEWD